MTHLALTTLAIVFNTQGLRLVYVVQKTHKNYSSLQNGEICQNL